MRRVSKNSRATSWFTGLCIGCLAAAALVSCESLSLSPSNPVPVEDLKADEFAGNIFVSWTNPADFLDLRVQATGPDGVTRNLREAAYSLRQGPVGTLLRDLEPGNYRFQILSNASTSPSLLARSTVVECAVPEPVGGYLDLLGLGRPGRENLDILYLIHPSMSVLGKNGVAEPESPDPEGIFRHVAENVFSEVFRSAVPIRSERDVREIENARGIVAERTVGAPLWILDPDALIVVDFRQAGGRGELHQIHLRLLDLKLVRALYGSYNGLKLSNARALIAEGFAEVKPFEDPRQKPRDMVLALRDGWRDLLEEVIEHPRYRIYKAALEEAERGNLTERILIGALFFGEIPLEMRPSRGPEGSFEERIDTLEKKVLFGPPEVSIPEDEEEAPGVGPERTVQEASGGDG